MLQGGLSLSGQPTAVMLLPSSGVHPLSLARTDVRRWFLGCISGSWASRGHDVSSAVDACGKTFFFLSHADLSCLALYLHASVGTCMFSVWWRDYGDERLWRLYVGRTCRPACAGDALAWIVLDAVQHLDGNTCVTE